MANLYLISQDVNKGYDTYDSAVVCALDETEATKMHPSGCQEEGWDNPRKLWWEAKHRYGSWAPDLDTVSVKFLGTADESVPLGVVCASFNAG